MTDWDEMVQFINHAMEAVDEAQAASQTLKQEANHQSFAVFRERMKELEEHLQRLKTVLDNEEAFAMDELMDALSKVYSGHAADHRKTPRMTE
jgi:16S rRNA C1402 (ribose-2'-O) methylase RsmI